MVCRCSEVFSGVTSSWSSFGIISRLKKGTRPFFYYNEALSCYRKVSALDEEDRQKHEFGVSQVLKHLTGMTSKNGQVGDQEFALC